MILPAMVVQDLGTMSYRDAWAIQEQLHAQVLEGGHERLILVEHPPVITTGRRPVGMQHLVASKEMLAQMGVELVESDRGGDVTFHGPGQLVAYPIVRLADHRLSVSGYVHQLERVLVEMVGEFGVEAHVDPSAVGVWVGDAKVAAIGVRIRRGVSMHGIALNVTTDLNYFNLIVPCGLVGRPVTSLQKLLAGDAPAMGAVKQTLASRMRAAFG
jgi:lipoate-protein ligase B